MQQMEQTIQYQYAIIQQLTAQVEMAVIPQSQSSSGSSSYASSSSSSNRSSPQVHDPLAELTKQFDQMSAAAFAQMGGGMGGGNDGAMKRTRQS
jgi:hypothetical protein